MGRISASAKAAANRFRRILPVSRSRNSPRSAPTLDHEVGEDMKGSVPSKPSARAQRAEQVESEAPATDFRPSRGTGQTGFRFLAENESTTTVSSFGLESMAPLERCNHRTTSTRNTQQEQGSAVEEPNEMEPRSEERSDTSSLFGTQNPWNDSGVWGNREERKAPKLRLPSFVRKRAEEEKETGEGAAARVELGEGEEWELRPDEVGPIQYSSQDLFERSASDNLRPRRVDKRFSF